MFLGEYEHNLDDKGRLAVPARFREELGDGVVVTRGFDRCLMGFPRPIWEKLAQQVSGARRSGGWRGQLAPARHIISLLQAVKEHGVACAHDAPSP